MLWMKKFKRDNWVTLTFAELSLNFMLNLLGTAEPLLLIIDVHSML